MSALIAALILATAAPAWAQIQMRPTDPPLVTAVNERWYQLGEPLQFAGDLYYRAGAPVYFDGNRMVRTGHYNGVPLYADTTVEPYSLVLVPITRGVLQPYERLRRGDLAGTTGSRPPSFPVRVVPETVSLPAAGGAPTSLPQPGGALSVFTADPATAVFTTTAAPVATAAPSAPIVTPTSLASAQPPDSNDGIWISFRGLRWVAAGTAVPLTADLFGIAGQYGEVPVLVRVDRQDGLIYLPTTNGRVAPYRLR